MCARCTKLVHFDSEHTHRVRQTPLAKLHGEVYLWVSPTQTGLNVHVPLEALSNSTLQRLVCVLSSLSSSSIRRNMQAPSSCTKLVAYRKRCFAFVLPFLAACSAKCRVRCRRLGVFRCDGIYDTRAQQKPNLIQRSGGGCRKCSG